MKSAVIHLIRKPIKRRNGHVKRTACELVFNKRSMKVTDALDNITCRRCERSRYTALIRNFERN